MLEFNRSKILWTFFQTQKKNFRKKALENVEEIAQIILDNLEEEKYKEMVPSLFKKLEEKSNF